MIQNLIFTILFLKILLRACNAFIFVHTFQWTSSEFFFFIFRFSSRKFQSQQKLVKKITHFTIQFRSRNLTHFTNLNSLDNENNMLPKHSQKPFWLYKYFSKHVSVWCQKKRLDCIISWRQRTVLLKHFESKCLYISVYPRKENFCSKDVARFYLMGDGLRIKRDWIIFLRQLAVWAS